MSKSTSTLQGRHEEDRKTSTAPALRPPPPAIARYVLAFLSVLAAALAARGMEIYLNATPFASLFFCAVIFSAWFGGFGPGLLSVALSVLLFDYYFLAPTHSLEIRINEVPRLIIFTGSGLVIGLLAASQKSMTESLKRAQVALWAKMQELEKSNEALRGENVERKLAEEALRHSETFLAEAQRLSQTGSFSWKIATGEIAWSEETFHIFQVARTTKPTLEFVYERIFPADVALVKRALEQAVWDGKDFDIEHRLVMPDGSIKDVHVVAHGLSDEGGGIEFVGAVMDVTAQKQVERALRRSETYLDEAQGLTRTGSWVWDVSRRKVLYWSREMYRIYERDPALGPASEEEIKSLFPFDQWMIRQGAFEHAARNKCGFDFVVQLVFPNGVIKYLRHVAHPRVNSEEAVIEFVGTTVDITERKRTEDALNKAQAELAHITRMTTVGELTASIAHEVNQPLTAVINNATACLELMAAGRLDSGDLQAALKDIMSDAERASAVLERVRRLAKKAPFEKTLLDLRDVVTDVVALARYDSATRRVTIRTELPNEELLILGDRVQLQQVLLNLVVNGMDAMSAIDPAERLLTMAAHREMGEETREIVLSVRDAGVGFKPAEMDRLFEAFYTTKPQGMGMGLAISRSIIEAHDGRLRAEANPGSGATFLLRLPEATRGTGS